MGPLTGGSYELRKSSRQGGREVLSYLRQAAVPGLRSRGHGHSVLRELSCRARDGERAEFTLYRADSARNAGRSLKLRTESRAVRNFGRNPIWSGSRLQRAIRQGSGALDNLHLAGDRREPWT